MKRYIAVLLVALSLLFSQMACDESGELDGCRSPVCRDNCSAGDQACQIECCSAFATR